jgi:uncharacterized membrane protein YgaE (UPF0421/DUF939 family)
MCCRLKAARLAVADGLRCERTNTVTTNSAAVDARSWWERKQFHVRAMNAFKTALAAMLCLWLGHLFRLTHSYWAAVSAIVVMQSENAVTFASCRDRLLGTAVGALIGWGIAHTWRGHYVVYGVGVLLCLLICSLFEYEKAGRLAAVALTIIVLIHIDHGPRQAALARFLEVSLGIVVALAVTLLVFPQRRAAATAS